MPPTTAKQIDFLMSGITDVNGNPLAGGKVFAFDAGSNTPRDTWIDADKNTLSASPIVLDSRGTSLTFADGDYKFIIQNSEGVIIYTRDFEFYGSQGVGEFYITDDPSSGVPGAPGELVTGDGTDGGGGGANSGAQITDSGSVNSPAIPCGDSVPCHCGCCQPSSYRVTLGGQTGLFEDFNGVWIVQRAGGKIGLYHKVTPAGLITLDLGGITCTSLTIIAGDLIDTATIASPNSCISSGSVGALTWAICPLGTEPLLNPIEVTLQGLTVCTGCINSSQQSFNNITFDPNGTFSLNRVGCNWDTFVLSDMSGNRFSSNLDCVGTPIPITSNFMTVTVVIVGGTDVKVISNVDLSGDLGFVFSGTTPLNSGEDQCIDNLGIQNIVVCGEKFENTAVITKGGLANINWQP